MIFSANIQNTLEISKQDIEGLYDTKESLKILINKYCYRKVGNDEGQITDPHLAVSFVEHEKIVGVKNLNSLFKFLQKLIEENKDSYPLKISFPREEQNLNYSVSSPKMHYNYKY